MTSVQAARQPIATLPLKDVRARPVEWSAQLELIDDLAVAEPVWRRLEDDGAVATAFQNFDWVDHWFRHVGAPQGFRTLIVVGRDAARVPQFLLPFVYRPQRALVVAQFPGGEHSSINSGLWRRDAVTDYTARDVMHFLRAAGGARGVDLFALLQQPVRWHGADNPLALLPHQPSVDDVWRATLPPCVGGDVLAAILSSSMRGRLRGKARKLQKLAGYRYLRAETAADIDRLLDAFLTQKAAHFAAQGIHDVFSDPGVATFLRAACHQVTADGAPLIELHALENAQEVMAVLGGVATAHRFSCMFNSYTIGEAGRHSPGLILLTHVVPACAARGQQEFDLGPGYALYKTVVCREAEGVVDSFVPASWRGQLAAPVFRAMHSGKRRLKANPAWQNLAPALRRRFGGYAAASGSAAVGACSGPSASTTTSL